MKPRPRFFPMMGFFWGLMFQVFGQAQPQTFPLQFQHTQFDFGTIGELGGPVYHHFPFVNHSDDTVWIVSASANCHCTTGDFPKEAIPPDGVGAIKLSYDPKGRPWDFEATLEVVLKNKPKPLELKVKGKTVGGAETIRFAPVEYTQKFQYNEKSIEAKDKEFQDFVEKLLPLLERHKDIRVQIESSASHVPTKSFTDNKELTAQRARDARSKMLDIFISFHADLNRILFQDDKTLVQGPAYTADYKKQMAKYLPFQYVKIRVF